MEEKKGMILYYVQDEKKKIQMEVTVKAVRPQYTDWKTCWFEEYHSAGLDADREAASDLWYAGNYYLFRDTEQEFR